MEDFNEKCYNLIKKVPKGKVTTYKEVAKKLNSKGYRAVGNAMNKNRELIVIPCHRVVGSDGSLRGYVNGIEEKVKLLEREGVKVSGNKIMDLDKFVHRF